MRIGFQPRDSHKRFSGAICLSPKLFEVLLQAAQLLGLAMLSNWNTRRHHRNRNFRKFKISNGFENSKSFTVPFAWLKYERESKESGLRMNACLGKSMRSSFAGQNEVSPDECVGKHIKAMPQKLNRFYQIYMYIYIYINRSFTYTPIQTPCEFSPTRKDWVETRITQSKKAPFKTVPTAFLTNKLLPAAPYVSFQKRIY